MTTYLCMTIYLYIILYHTYHVYQCMTNGHTLILIFVGEIPKNVSTVGYNFSVYSVSARPGPMKTLDSSVNQSISVNRHKYSENVSHSGYILGREKIFQKTKFSNTYFLENIFLSYMTICHTWYVFDVTKITVNV